MSALMCCMSGLLYHNVLWLYQVTTVQHKQMFVPNQQLPSPHVGTLDGGGQFAAAPPGGFLGSKRAGAMQQAVSRYDWSSVVCIASILPASRAQAKSTLHFSFVAGSCNSLLAATTCDCFAKNVAA